ncbi:MAG: TonB-dependent receptor, partial [Verrucomicrobiota bacterium]
MLCLSPIALPSRTAAQGPAQSKSIDFQIEAQPLGEALTAYAIASGLGVSADADLLEGKMSSSVYGTMLKEAALERLLVGTGLEFRMLDANRVVVQRGRSTDPPLIRFADVTLKGELLDRTLQNSMTSASVTMGFDIESTADIDLVYVLQRKAGVNLFGSSIAIRGISSSGPAGLGTGGLITTTIDGNRVSLVANQASIENSTWDLEQVEVLRGPQSTQSGANSLAGAVNIRSKDPVHHREGKLRIGVGNGDKQELAVAANFPVIQDSLAVRVSAEAVRSDGFVRNPILEIDDVDSIDRDLLRLGLLWEPTDRWTSVLKMSYSDAAYGSVSVNRAEFPENRLLAQNTEDVRIKEVYSINLENSFELTESLRIESSTVYSDFDIYTQFESSFFGIIPVVGAREFDQEVFDQELKLSFEGDNGIRAVGGFFYSESDNKSRTFAFLATDFTVPPGGLPLPGLPPLPPGFTLPAGASLSDGTGFSGRDSQAIFGEVEFPIIESLSGVVGVRYDESEFGSQESDATVPKVGVVYELDAGKKIGFTYQEGFREGGERTYNVTDSTSGTPVTREVIVPFEPQFSKNYEIGFRSEWLGSNLLFNANVFYTQWEDMQVRELVAITDPNIVPDIGASVTTNAAESTLWGGEIDLRYVASERLELYSSIAYSETEFEDFVSFESGAPLDLSGKEFVGAPEWSGNVGAVYRFGEGWQFGIDASYTDSTYSEAENLAALENDAFWLVDLRLAKAISDRLTITVYIDNALDEDYSTQRNGGDQCLRHQRGAL